MSGYWDGRFSAEGEIWGRAPSTTVEAAVTELKKAGARTVLVPGCGYGRNAEALARAGFTVTGVEVSARAIALAPRPSPVTYIQGSVLDALPGEHSFDAIYCFNVLHLFRAEDRARFLCACLRALAPEGTAFFVVFSDREPSRGKGSMTEPMTWESKPGRPVHYFTDEDLRAHFSGWLILGTGEIDDPESHGAEGPHTHRLRWICAQARGQGGPPRDFDGGAYAKASSHQMQWGRAVLADLEIRGDESVLDLGCGDGALTLMIAERVPRGRVRGIDSSPAMIRTALSRTAPPNVSFALMDVLDLDADAEFDLIFSNAALHWVGARPSLDAPTFDRPWPRVNDHARLLSACARALAPGGIMRLNFAAEGNCPAFITTAREAMAEKRFAPFFSSFRWPWFMPGLDEYRSILHAASLHDAKAWVEPADRRFADEEELVRWIDQPSLVPFLAAIGDERERKAFRDLVVRRMIERTRLEDGGFMERFRRMNVLWRKP